MNQWTVINSDEVIKSGENVRFTFKWTVSNTWLRASQLALIENRLNRLYPDFEIIRYDWTDDGVIIECRVRTDMENKPVTQEAGIAGAIIAVAIATAIVGGMFFFWLSLDKVEKLIKIPDIGSSIKIGTVAILIFAAAYFLIAWRKK